MLFGGCFTKRPEEAYVTVQPRTRVARTITGFTESLRCMDELFELHGVRGVRITTIGIPDATGKVSAGTRDMLISAVSTMSTRSGAFTYVDWDFTNREGQLIYNMARQSSGRGEGAPHSLPDFYIRGAITQLDNNVQDHRKGGGVAVDLEEYAGDLAHDRNATSSVVALDLNLARVATREVIPGLTSHNSLVITRRGQGLDTSLSLKKAGLFYSVEADEAEGLHVGVRTLVELGAIEILGRLTQVPYWRCLEIESTNPEVLTTARDWYDDLGEAEREMFAQRVLVGAGYLAGPPRAASRADLRGALAVYQRERDLVPTGTLTFETYLAMLGSRRPLALGPPEGGRPAEALDPSLAVRRPVSLRLDSGRGGSPRYRVGEELELALRVSGNAFVYCFYRDGSGRVARILPNRFQPDPYRAASEVVRIPGPGSRFRIVFETPGASEEVACVASDRELGLHLPLALKQADLTPLPVSSVDEVIATFEGIDRTGLAVARLPIAVSAP